jgi:myosin heavy subunit
MLITKGLHKLLYYAIFFGISGIVHYYFCFYQPDQSKVVKVSLAAVVKAPKTEPEKQPEQPKPEKQPEPKPEEKKPAEKLPETPPPSELQKKLEQELEKRIKYQENLEETLRREWQYKMAELEKQKQTEVDKVKKELQQEQQKKLEELDNAKKKQEEMSQQLTQKMLQLNQQLANLEVRRQEQEKQLAKTMQNLQQENEQQLQKAMQQKMQELAQKNNTELAQLKKTQERAWREERKKSEKELDDKMKQLQQKETELASLSQDVRKIEQKRLQEVKQLQEERVVQQQRQQDLERKISRQQQELEQKMSEKIEQEKANILAKQGELEKQILYYKQQLEAPPTSNSKSERDIINQQWNFLEKVRASSLSEHQAYIEKFTTTPGEGVKVPSLDFQDDNFRQKKYEVMAFHKMQIIAYQQAQHSFITIDLDLSPGRGRYRKRTDFQHLQSFSNRTISAEPVFPQLIAEIRQSDELYDANDGPLYLAFVFPQKTANYLAWKSITVCKKFGYDPAKVTVCQSHFQLTRNGYWSLIINRLRLSDGRWVDVEDFEQEW